MTNQPTNPEPAIEIDYREVARRVTRMMEALLVSPEALFLSVESTAQAWEHWSEQAEWMLRAEQTYLASKGVTPAEDPRDAEIRELKTEIDVLRSNQTGLLLDKRNLTEQVHNWCRRALAAESKPVEKPVEADLTAAARARDEIVKRLEEAGIGYLSQGSPDEAAEHIISRAVEIVRRHHSVTAEAKEPAHQKKESPDGS